MEDDDSEFLAELREEFFTEAKETLLECENILINIENGDSSGFDQYKRQLHSLKGSAHAVDLKKIAAILHTMEDWIKDNKITEIVEISLTTIDYIRQAVEASDSGDEAGAEQILDSYLSQIKSA